MSLHVVVSPRAVGTLLILLHLGSGYNRKLFAKEETVFHILRSFYALVFQIIVNTYSLYKAEFQLSNNCTLQT